MGLWLSIALVTQTDEFSGTKCGSRQTYNQNSQYSAVQLAQCYTFKEGQKSPR